MRDLYQILVWEPERALGIGGRIIPTINWRIDELDSGGLGYVPIARSNSVTKLQAPKNLQGLSWAENNSLWLFFHFSVRGI